MAKHIQTRNPYGHPAGHCFAIGRNQWVDITIALNGVVTASRNLPLHQLRYFVALIHRSERLYKSWGV